MVPKCVHSETSTMLLLCILPLRCLQGRLGIPAASVWFAWQIAEQFRRPWQYEPMLTVQWQDMWAVFSSPADRSRWSGSADPYVMWVSKWQWADVNDEPVVEGLRLFHCAVNVAASRIDCFSRGDSRTKYRHLGWEASPMRFAVTHLVRMWLSRVA